MEPTATTSSSSSGKAITALVLGILSIVCCGLLGPVAWYMGSAEHKATGDTMAKVGMILGIIGTIFLGLGLIWMFFAGGMAILQGMAGGF